MKIDQTFCLIHVTGAKLYPYMVKSKTTGRIAFRVAAPGKRDAKGQAEEVTDIETAKEKVYRHGYSIRAKTEAGDRHGSYRLNGRGIVGSEPPAAP